MELIRTLVENQSQMVVAGKPQIPRKAIRRYKVTLKAEVGKGKFLTFETNVTAEDRKEALDIGRRVFNQTLERYHSVGYQMAYQDAQLVKERMSGDMTSRRAGA